MLLIQTNPNLEYAVLAGVTPTAKYGWYPGLNIKVCRFMLAMVSHLIITQVHALHTKHSIFAGMLMFTEEEVIALRTLSKVSHGASLVA